ncbi:hypothetical protein HU200_026950 [Digitaria exilis]|uniref:Uncharacterized protein n=1 Tax=Digitaria exilis TaxID=1010633 RepID=A0A835ERM2_9POAL|nr:hypothetical protein HU200_026950 [Digitaria exilis]
MDAAAPRPSSYAITAETTGLDVDPDLAGHGRGRDLVLHLTVTETHKWFGIGGRSALLRRPRSLRRQAWTALPCPAAGYLQCSGECRRLMVRLTTQELRKDEALRRMIPMAYCNDAVPTGVEALVAERAAALTTDSCRRACRCEVAFRIDIEVVYDEVEVLLQACADAGELSGAGDGDGDAPPCAIDVAAGLRGGDDDVAAGVRARLP